MRIGIKWSVVFLGAVSLPTLFFANSGAQTLQLPEDRLDKFAAAAVSTLKVVYGKELPEDMEVALNVSFKGDEKRPVAFAFKDLQAALDRKGIKVTSSKKYVVNVLLIPQNVKVASLEKKPMFLPTYDLEGSIKAGEKMTPIAFKSVEFTPDEKEKAIELADPLYEETALLNGIPVDVTKAGGLEIGGTSLARILEVRTAKPPIPYISGGTKIYSASGGEYALEVFPAKPVPVGGGMRIEQGETPYAVYKDKNGYAHVDLNPGNMFVLRVYNEDKEYEASARVMIDTLDSFEFSDNEARRGGKARWLIGKDSWVDVQGFDYKEGKGLAFVVGNISDINVGGKEETARIQKIVELKNSKSGGQICVSFRKAWEGSRRPADESLLPKAHRIIPGAVFDRKLVTVTRERGTFRANIVIRYGAW